MKNYAVDGPILALSGGVGGAKLALGLSHSLPPERLYVLANTADDFEHLGLQVSPDLDTLMYTLAGISNPETGWGLKGETWNCMQALEGLGGEAWFRLGDRDLATHIYRTASRARGATLTDVTVNLCARLGVTVRILPMSDDPVRTMVTTDQGELSFQHYFVREQCAPKVRAIRFEGHETGKPGAQILSLLKNPDLAGILICPSNPFLSIDPILSVSGLADAIRESVAPVIAVSPLIGGKAVKGPTAKIMKELNIALTASAIADHYGDLLDGIILDQDDAHAAPELEARGLFVGITDTLMQTPKDKTRVADYSLGCLQALRAGGNG